jgi:hypothetical protein
MEEDGSADLNMEAEDSEDDNWSSAGSSDSSMHSLSLFSSDSSTSDNTTFIHDAGLDTDADLHARKEWTINTFRTKKWQQEQRPALEAIGYYDSALAPFVESNDWNALLDHILNQGKQVLQDENDDIFHYLLHECSNGYSYRHRWCD